jgi:hypothetical protein
MSEVFSGRELAETAADEFREFPLVRMEFQVEFSVVSGDGRVQFGDVILFFQRQVAADPAAVEETDDIQALLLW